MNHYSDIHISITTRCNMSCPYCCYGMNHRKQFHSVPEELFSDAVHFRSLNEFTITGGEPTTHPMFDEIVYGLVNVLSGLEVRIETNGLLYRKWKEVFRVFDLINITHYTTECYDGCLDNTEIVNEIVSSCKNVRVLKVIHEKNRDVKSDVPCGRQARPHYSHRLIYGCCVGAGPVGAIGVPVTENWQEQLFNTPLPCKNCLMGIPI